MSVIGRGDNQGGEAEIMVCAGMLLLHRERVIDFTCAYVRVAFQLKSFFD